MEDHVRIFDTTLRDGEQSPGATMTLDEKLVIAKALEQLGVDVIEAGFPIASPGELSSVRAIAEACQRAEVAALCRTRGPDIEAAGKAVEPAAHGRIHVFIATSKLHMQHKLKLEPDQVLDEIARGVSQAKSLCPSVEFSAEDATRTELSFLKEAFACAIESGATTLNIPDTVGYTMPQEYTKIVSEIMQVVGDRPVVVSTHCHNDLGLATANSIAAVAAGARQVECCVNGIGERAGNAALEEIVMALRTRRDLVGVETRINTRDIMKVSRLITSITGLHVAASKPIVGRNAFAHESGIHQHGMLTHRETYEIMLPADIGLEESKLVLGKHSGKHALAARLAELGYKLSANELAQVFERFKALADKKKNIYDEDLASLISDGVNTAPAHYQLVNFESRCATDGVPWAKVTVAFDGQEKSAESEGNGPVHAVIEAIKACTGNEDVRMADFRIEAVSGGADAQARTSLSIEDGEHLARGQGTHIDIVLASARAYLDALNQREYQRRLG